MKLRRCAAWLLLYACVACSGTETGNPPTRGVDCSKQICGPCAPPIVLRVTSAVNDGPVEELSVDGEPAVCRVAGVYSECQLDGSPYAAPGTHLVTLSAPGYEPLGVEVVLAASTQCCSCGYQPILVHVALSPLPSAG